MHGKTRNALLGYGLASDLIEKIGDRGHTLGELRALSRQKLLGHYTSDEVDQIKARIDRTPIPETVIETVISKAGGACCYCGDGNSTRPFQIHHVDPYSETQDNSEENLLLVCPTHHVVIHSNDVSRLEQRGERRRWHATIEIASDFAAKGLAFPFGTFQALDYESAPKPVELVEFGPLSPSTALISYPEELAVAARARLELSSFLLILGGSGSGKSTYATALGGLYEKDGFRVFRHCYGKQAHDSLKQVSLFISACVRKAIVILDDANTWATAADLQQLGKIVSGLKHVRVIANWTADDSDDGSKLQASDLPKQVLLWSDLRPAVVETLLKHEGDIVESLQKYESDRSIGSLGLGSLHSRLEERISALGDKPKTVYEFIFGLRGEGVAVAEEFRKLVQEDRTDIPVLHVAIEQIAGFEQPTSIEETVAACLRAEGSGYPPASQEWVEAALNRQVRCKRLVRVRDRYTTIHRKWAARIIAAGLESVVAKPATELLLKHDFQVASASPERLLRLWSWLRSLDESRPFVKGWEKSLSLDDWTQLVGGCARRGLMEVGFVARQMHLLFDNSTWTSTVAKSFEQNAAAITSLIYGASPTDWYWLHQISMAMEHACPDAWTRILQGWDRKSVAALLRETPLDQFDNFWWACGKARSLCPGWLEGVGEYLTWEDFSERLNSVEAGDLRSLFEAFEVFGALGHKLRRSMLRRVCEAMKAALAGATIEDLRLRETNTTMMSLTLFFPEDVQRAFAVIDVQKFGQALGRSLPRHWRPLCTLSSWAHQSGSKVCEQIISWSNLSDLEQQVQRYGTSNRYELRLLLHFLRSSSVEHRESLAANLNALVRRACESKDSEASSILTAYHRLHPELGMALAAGIGIELKEIKEKAEGVALEAVRQKFRDKDATGEDYEININEQDSEDAGEKSPCDN